LKTSPERFGNVNMTQFAKRRLIVMSIGATNHYHRDWDEFLLDASTVLSLLQREHIKYQEQRQVCYFKT